MHITVTVKAAPLVEASAEHFAANFSALKQHFEMLRTDGAFGPVDKCEIRFLVVGSKGEELSVEPINANE